MKKQDQVHALFDFIRRSPTAFHAVDTAVRILQDAGYRPLSLSEAPVAGGRYYTTKNGSSLIAFRLPETSPSGSASGAPGRGFLIAASHSDSPTFRVKITPTLTGAYTRLAVEKYGGMIFYTWFDRPLSVAGRVFVRTESGVSGRLVHIDRDLLAIPSVAIHMNRAVNDGYKFNPAVDLLPLYGDAGREDLLSAVAREAGVTPDAIVGHDLFLTVREEGKTFGAENEFILSPRLDDIECVYTSLAGFLAAKAGGSIPVLAVFDNEEVGSETKQGAASAFFADTLRRIAGSDEAYAAMLEDSFMVSADNAHALHPNHPEYADAANAPLLNGGVVVKYNAAQRYTTDGFSDAVLREICRKAGVKLQSYCNRADLPGGSTLGSIADTKLPIPTVDIGLPQLAMHAAVETAGTKDVADAVKLFTAFFSCEYRKEGENVLLR